MKFDSSRFFFATVALIVISLLSFGYYLEHALGLSPCPLCVLQRYCYYGILTSALIGLSTFNFRSLLFLSNLFLMGFSALGITLAGRQVWLQRFSSKESMECIPSFDFLVNNLPLDQIIYKIYSGGTDCANVDWVFLGGSIADWSTLCFVSFFFGTFKHVISSKNNRSF